MQIDLEPHEHSTLIEVVKVRKRLFYVLATMWALIIAGLAITTYVGWMAIPIGVFSVFVGATWVGAYPEAFMKRLRN